MAKKRDPRYVKTIVPLSDREILIYASPAVSGVLKELGQLDLFAGVKVIQLIEAAYDQGKKDGAAEVKTAFEEMMVAIPHKNPGRPLKRLPSGK